MVGHKAILKRAAAGEPRGLDYEVDFSRTCAAAGVARSTSRFLRGFHTTSEILSRFLLSKSNRNRIDTDNAEKCCLDPKNASKSLEINLEKSKTQNSRIKDHDLSYIRGG